jgi:hypothetical protein
MKLFRRRKAEYKATLIYADEPQLILLSDGRSPILAVAIPDNDPNKAMFLAVSVSKKNWQNYLDGNCDLRYLYTYPKLRTIYSFDLNLAVNNFVTMDQVTLDPVPEDWLPEPRLFSVYHTEPLPTEPVATGEEVLVVDGEWDIPEFGTFYQRYSDIYAFLAAIRNWMDASVSEEAKRKLLLAFRTKPFQGGFSYVHFFDELVSSLSRNQRLGLEKISYASPGTVEIRGEQTIFGDIEEMVPAFLETRSTISEAYRSLYSYLSQNKYLQMAGENFRPDEPAAPFILRQTKTLALMMGIDDFDAVLNLTGGNALVTAKIILSFHRRFEEAAAYFAQGRVSYTS